MGVVEFDKRFWSPQHRRTTQRCTVELRHRSTSIFARQYRTGHCADLEALCRRVNAKSQMWMPHQCSAPGRPSVGVLGRGIAWLDTSTTRSPASGGTATIRVGWKKGRGSKRDASNPWHKNGNNRRNNQPGDIGTSNPRSKAGSGNIATCPKQIA